MLRLRLSLFLAVPLCLPATALDAQDAASTDTRVETPSGPLIGTLDPEQGVRSFLGVPYAQPPVGALRWRHARAVEPWDEARRADAYSLAAIQAEPRPYEGIGERGEDCLALNVYAPAPAEGGELAPVFFWIHGGGFQSGSAMSAEYDGARLAEAGVCVVVPNYRLGPLGFLAHPALSAEGEGSGNQALSDLICALEWVRTHARSFGADPERVTIAGQSAGGSAVAALLCARPAQGLFHQAIVHSGGASRRAPALREDPAGTSAEEYGLHFARALGIEGEGAEALAALRAVPAERLLEAWDATREAHGRFDLCSDGRLLERAPGESLDLGTFANVRLMVGETADEASMFFMRGGAQSRAEYESWMRERFGSLSERALEFYAADAVEQFATQQQQASNDGYSTHARLLARSMAPGQATWRYRFTRVSPFGESMRLGSYHGAEIAYVFGHVEEGRRYTAEDVALAERMRAHWVAFVSEGDPNAGLELPRWEPFTPEEERYHVFDASDSSGAAWRNAACDLREAAWRAEEAGAR